VLAWSKLGWNLLLQGIAEVTPAGTHAMSGAAYRFEADPYAQQRLWSLQHVWHVWQGHGLVHNHHV
jgi:hypothetical protein